MPNLSIKAVHQFWHDYNDPIIYRVVSFMESVEHWTYDDDATINEQLRQLGKALDAANAFELKKEACYISIMANLSMGRLLRILQAIDTTSPGSASKVLMYSEENNRDDETIAFFLRRNIAFERLRLLTRVFSPARVNLLSKTLEGEENEQDQ